MLEEQLGIRFGWATNAAARDAIISCVKKQSEKLGFDEITYYNTLLKSPAELFTLAEEAAAADTRFFREAKQFACLKDKILPELAKSNKLTKQLRIWSTAVRPVKRRFQWRFSAVSG